MVAIGRAISETSLHFCKTHSQRDPLNSAGATFEVCLRLDGRFLNVESLVQSSMGSGTKGQTLGLAGLQLRRSAMLDSISEVGAKLKTVGKVSQTRFQLSPQASRCVL